MSNEQQRYDHEVMSQLQYWEDIHSKGQDYRLKNDPDFMDWLEARNNEDLLYQMRDSHQTE